jgi:hypothetical protein
MHDDEPTIDRIDRYAYYERIIVATSNGAFAEGLVVETLRGLILGARLLHLVRRRHPHTVEGIWLSHEVWVRASQQLDTGEWPFTDGRNGLDFPLRAMRSFNLPIIPEMTAFGKAINRISVRSGNAAQYVPTVNRSRSARQGS